MSSEVPRVRLGLVALGGLAMFFLLANHLYGLQIQEGDYYQKRALANTVVIQRNEAPRGKIFDCQGRLLVSNEPEFQLIGIPGEMQGAEETLKQASRVLGQPLARLRNRYSKAKKLGPLEPVVLARSLSVAQVVGLTPLSQTRRGIYLKVKERRRYVGGLHASQVLGFVGEIDGDELKTRRRKGFVMGDSLGKEGVEKTYDGILRGRKGITYLYIDALGRTVKSVEMRPPVPGSDLYLTLDWDLQQKAEEALQATLDELAKKNGERTSGAVVSMECKTGRVRALAGLPQYDPRPFARGITASEYSRLANDPAAPLINRAFQCAFSPGSTFKIINSSASLQEGLCTPSTVFFCGGSYAGANCFVRGGHGSINFEASLALSCDVVYYMLGDRLGIGRLKHYAWLFGLGHPTGLDLPGETGGVMPDEAWKKKYIGDGWFQGDTVNSSIGQGFVLVSPLQMAVATGAVATGGEVHKPHTVEKAVSYQGRVDFRDVTQAGHRVPVKPELLAAVRQGMRGAVLYGTGGAANSPLVQVSGKTGTVETNGRNHTWFVSFAPFDKPELVTVVFLEKSGGFGGSMAAPIARQVIDYYFGEIKHLSPPATEAKR